MLGLVTIDPQGGHAGSGPEVTIPGQASGSTGKRIS